MGKKIKAVLILILGYILCIITAALSGWGVPDQASLAREVIQGTSVEIAGCLLMLGLFFAVIRKRFSSAQQYATSPPERKIIAGAFLVCPFLCLIRVIMAFVNSEPLFSVDLDASWADIGEQLAFLPYTSILGPLMEELSMRVFAITPFATKKGKLIAAATTSLLFALMHGSQWLIHFLPGVIYSVLLLLSGNVWVSVCFHIANNLAATLIPVLTEIYVMMFPNTRYGIMGTPLLLVFLMVILFGVGIRLLVLQCRDMVRTEREGIAEKSH